MQHKKKEYFTHLVDFTHSYHRGLGDDDLNYNLCRALGLSAESQLVQTVGSSLDLGSQRRCSPPSCATTVPKPSSCRVTEQIKWNHRFFWAINLSPFTMIASHMTHMTLFGKRLCCYARSAAMVGEDLIASKSEALQSSHVMHLHFHQYHLADQS